MTEDSGSEGAKPSAILDKEFLDILVCPEDKTKLRQATDAEVKALNDRIQGGKLLNRGGDKVGETVDGGLIREDGAWLYPIREGIPVLLIEEAISLTE